MQEVLSAVATLPALTIYFDGGGSVNDPVKEAVVVDPNGEPSHFQQEAEGCNNVAEALAAIQAVKMLTRLNPPQGASVHIVGDSELVIKYMSGLYTAPGEAKFRASIEMLRNEFANAGVACSVEWVHTPKPKNLAGKELEKIQKRRKRAAAS